jgi:hypothetical protein
VSTRISMVVMVLLLGASCTGSSGVQPTAQPSDGATATRQSVLRFAARIEVPRPSAEPDSWNSIIISAEGKVCPNTNSLNASVQDLTAVGAVMEVKCTSGRPRYVQVTFRGVTVPHLAGLPLRVASKLLSLTGLSVGSVTYERNPPKTTNTDQRIRLGDIFLQSARPGTLRQRHDKLIRLNPGRTRRRGSPKHRGGGSRSGRSGSRQRGPIPCRERTRGPCVRPARSSQRE